MSDTKENMEKRVVSLASSGVIGYYIFSKLNAAQDTAEVPEDGLNLPPALKEATFYEGGIVSVESVKRMSEIIAEQARVYAATIRNGIRTPIVVEEEQPEVVEEENIEEDDIDDTVIEEPSVENDIEIYDEEETDTVDDSMFEEPIIEEPVIEELDIDEPIVEESEDDIQTEEFEEFVEEPVDETTEESVEEPSNDVTEEPAEADVQPIYVPVTVAEEIPEEAPVVVAPATFADMGGFENIEPATLPVTPVLSDDAALQMPVAAAGLPDITLPSVEDVQFEEPVVEEAPIVEEPTLMENVEPLHKVEEEEEDPRNKEQFKSIADFLNTL